MQKKTWMQTVSLFFALLFVGLLPSYGADQTGAATTPVRMTVSLRVLGDNKRMPEVTQQDVVVKQGRERLQVTGWKPAQDQGGMNMFVLIDDASDPVLASQFDDLRNFLNSQPSTTAVGVGYMRNGTVQIAQDFTTDHVQAANALRIPLASSGAYGSPYLSAIDLMKRWPEDGNRRELLMVTDGIDRFRGGPHYRGLRVVSPDVDSASRVAQRTGTVVNTIFARGVGRLGDNFWEIINGQNGIAKLSDESGGQSYYFATQNAVSFKPYLDDLQKSLDNKYVLEFRVVAGKKSGPQYVKLSTEVAGVELNAADSVWVNAK